MQASEDVHFADHLPATPRPWSERMQSRWRTWKGQELMHLDYSGFKNDFDALRREVTEADSIIVRQRLASVLVLIDLRDTVASSAVVNMFKQSAPQTSPYIRRHALIGVTGMKRFLAETVARIAGRRMRAFDTEEAAFEWLLDGAEDVGVPIGAKR